MARFSDETLRRYSRQILLREVGGRGQERLLRSRAELLILPGGGGIAAVAAQYLLRAGVAQVRWFAATESAAEPLHRLAACEHEPAAPESLQGDAPLLHSGEARLLPAPDADRPRALRGVLEAALCVGAWPPDCGDATRYLATESGCRRCRIEEDDALKASPLPAVGTSPPSPRLSDGSDAIDAQALTLGSALALAMLQGLLQIGPAPGVFFEPRVS